MRSLAWVLVLLTPVMATSRARAQQASAIARAPQEPLPPGYAGSASCNDCHKKEVALFSATAKGSLLMKHPRNTHEKLGCEACHGPSKQHGNSGGEERGALVAFGGKHPSPVAQRNAVGLPRVPRKNGTDVSAGRGARTRHATWRAPTAIR